MSLPKATGVQLGNSIIPCYVAMGANGKPIGWVEPPPPDPPPETPPPDYGVQHVSEVVIDGIEYHCIAILGADALPLALPPSQPPVSGGVINIAVTETPAAPVDGDMWLENNSEDGLKIQINGATRTVALVAAAPL